MKSSKYRVFVPEVSLSQLKSTEASCKNADELAKGIFRLVFKHDLETRPNEICATANRLEGREVCDPIKLRGIRCKYYITVCCTPTM